MFLFVGEPFDQAHSRQIKRLLALMGNEVKEYSCRMKFFFDRYLPIEEKTFHSVISVPPW